MRLNKLPNNPGNGITLVKFLPEEENYEYVERSYNAKDQFQYSEVVAAEVKEIGPNCQDFNVKKGDVILLYTKSLLQPRFIDYKGEKYYLVHMANSFVAGYSKKTK